MDCILGQDRSLEILRAALRSGRFHHAWIFSGPKGVGKFTTAIEVAKVLLDPDAAPDLSGQLRADPAGRVAREIDAGTHPDLHVIRKELALYSDSRELRERKQMTIPIDLLRERVIGGKVGEVWHEAAAYRTALRGHGKVFIIDEAELLAREAQNAMLKTLEEPPPQTYFFLISSQPEELYPTILSRCQHVRFGVLDAKSMQECVKKALSSRHEASGGERGAPDAKTMAWVMDFAEGSPGVALLALEYGFHEWKATLDPMLADLERGRFPVAMGEALGTMADDFAVAWVKAHKNASKDAANKAGARHVLSLLAAHARRKLAAAARGGAHGGAADSPYPWPEVIDLVCATEDQLGSNVNLKLAMENLVVQWARLTGRVAA